MFYICSSLNTIYASEKFVTTGVTSSTNMFLGCSKLVGGAGTEYNYYYKNATYARIDGGPDSATPGYFTERPIQ